ncbi:FKBP-type 22 kDa peptidyl-prolyl cis-trans isomerase [compost metagenome]
MCFSVQAQTAKKTVPSKNPVPAAAKKIIPQPAVKKTVAAPVFKSNLDSASYAFGLSMATQLKSGGLKNLNYDLLSKAVKDVFTESTPLLSPENAQACISNLFEKLSHQQEEINKQKYASNISEGSAFLTNNKTKPEVKVTLSGLQYEVLTAGNGEKPSAEDQVTVHYKGTLLNGFEFDSSYKRGEPATFRLNEVIKGWTEGVQLMSPGAKYRFFIPYDLAYGSRGAGADIPPYSTLIFEVELLKVGTNK